MKFKRLIPALAMLLVSAILLGTSTFAWFSMNTQVTATGMKVQAVAEDGLLIKNELDTDTAANWKATTTASYSNMVELAPTSTADVTAWYHNKSDAPTTAKAHQATASYETLSSNAGWKRDTGASATGAYYIDTDNGNDLDAAEKAYVLLNKFYIKSSGDEITLGAGNTYQALYVNKINVSSASTAVTLDASLRVAVKIGSQVFIYAPVSGATTSYYVAGAATAISATAVPTGGIVNTATSQASIPAISEAVANTIEAEVYIYFEGEDEECKSENLSATLDTLNVEVIFGITTVA